ncbi:phosphatidylserine/phosphatidylglycerophosphate/cardiolipin synthase family protein [Actinomadura sp. 6N118]|uniref:phosphatidylserine/phosphatidylglycerophosphate/ cardiolipin synthase family protein n=1 Tax=Actinomadura sp. 6N118 TaxID=3375151 RepID=UPI0037A7A388
MATEADESTEAGEAHEIDAFIDSACGDDPVAAGTARRALAWLAQGTGGGTRGGGTRTARRQRLVPSRGLLNAMVGRGILIRENGGYGFADERVRARLAELWVTRGPASLTTMPALTRFGSGWAAAQGPQPTTGNRIEFLIDNESAWARLAEEVATARRSVRAMLFMLDVPHVRMEFGMDPVGNPGPAGGVRLEESLLEAAGRGVAVHVVLNHPTPAASPANTTHPVERFLRRHDPEGLVRTRRLATPQTLPIHAKVFVIDDRAAFLIGSVFAQEYFDGREHRIDDPRRGHLRWRSSVRAPVHDVSARIEGPAVADLDATFRLHWDHARPSPKRTVGPAPAPFEPLAEKAEGKPAATGTTTLQVTRTLTGARRYAEADAGETGIYESYLRALESAERFVYLENQYLTCPELVDALIRAARRASGLQLILLLNIKPDVPNYVIWQRRALERLLAGMAELGDDRLGIFTLWSHEQGTHRTRILRNHVHSKVAIVDDSWLSVGSANLDSLSLSHSQHELLRPPLIRLGRLVNGASGGDPWQARATEVNVTCVGEDDVRPFRRDLWAEHLGLPSPNDPALDEPALDEPSLGEPALNEPPPEGGWLELWRRRAELKLDGLRARDPTVSEPRVLPYPHLAGCLPRHSHRASDHLRALGVNVDLLDVHDRFRSFSFRQGRWR